MRRPSVQIEERRDIYQHPRQKTGDKSSRYRPAYAHPHICVHRAEHEPRHNATEQRATQNDDGHQNHADRVQNRRDPVEKLIHA